MWPLFGLGLAGPLAQSAAGIFNNERNIDMQQETNAANAAMAREQMSFQERMSNSAYQRQARDLEKAGLNRILGATSGGGASTPGGASSTAVAPRSDLGNVISGSINSGAELFSRAREDQLRQAQINSVNADVANKVVDQELKKLEVVAKNVDMPAFKKEAMARQVMADFQESMGPSMKKASLLIDGIGASSSAANVWKILSPGGRRGATGSFLQRIFKSKQGGQ